MTGIWMNMMMQLAEMQRAIWMSVMRLATGATVMVDEAERTVREEVRTAARSPALMSSRTEAHGSVRSERKKVRAKTRRLSKDITSAKRAPRAPAVASKANGRRKGSK